MDPTTEMNSQEVEAVAELRKRVCDVIPKFKREIQRLDLSLLRFLRARDLNLNKAEAMLRNHIDWRENNQMDDIHEMKLPTHFFDDFPVKVCGRDKEGFLVGAFQIGKWDFRSMVEAGLTDEFLLFVLQWIERCFDIFDQLTTDKKFYSQSCLILDFEGFSYRQVASKAFISMVLELIKTFEANYPEVLRVIWVINAPTMFNIFWGIIKPFLTERTTSKIRIFGGNKTKWREDILAMVHEDNIPSLYSGANTCCPDFDIDSGVDVKKLSPNYRAFPIKDMKSVYVAAGTLSRVEVEASSGSQIHWNFVTDNDDIVFHVDFEDVVNIIEPCRVDSHLCVQKGKINVGKSGQYNLVFDNTYSLYKGKFVRYTVWTN